MTQPTQNQRTGAMPPTPAIPEGYQPFTHSGPFGDCIGPFYFRRRPSGGFRYAFQTGALHANPNGVTHGGALYCFADHITGHAVVNQTERMCATIKFKVEYLASAPLDSLVEAEVDLLRITRTVVFLRLRLFTADRTLMTANGVYKLFAPFKPGQGGAAKPAGPPPDDIRLPPPKGFQPFPNQAAFAELCGPTHYSRPPEGGFLNGFQARPLHDNTNRIVHGGVLFSFADDIMGRASSGASRRFTTTVALNVEYLASAPLDAWVGGKTEVSYMDDDIAFMRGRVYHGERTLLTADGVYKLLGPYQNPEAAA
ncbi:MAG: PaaI family thioesterase [Rhodospirillaceae bacterium]|nr:PaaI family thioesterase [Rhodospirillaceae bacterium]